MNPKDTIRQWAREEIEPWAVMPAAEYAEACNRLVFEHGIFAIDITGREVTVRQRQDAHPILRNRAEAYASYIRSLDSFDLTKPLSVLINVDDLAEENGSAPVLTFQRRIGSRNPLLPDLDTVISNFYTSLPVPDEQPFSEKYDSAIFVGSTTGALSITRSHLGDPFPRLRTFRYFRAHPQVHVRLPSIVQVADPTVVSALQQEGLGGPNIAFSDQILHKLLLSIDGNGAALSRPYLALYSNCALVKYYSDYEAWYFRRLVPGEHYISVDRDEQVLELVDGDLNRHEPIAKSGRAFVEKYLTPDMHSVYTRSLLSELANRISP